METQLTGDALTSILKALGLVQQPHLGAWEANSRAVRSVARTCGDDSGGTGDFDASCAIS